MPPPTITAARRAAFPSAFRPIRAKLRRRASSGNSRTEGERGRERVACSAPVSSRVDSRQRRPEPGRGASVVDETDEVGEGVALGSVSRASLDAVARAVTCDCALSRLSAAPSASSSLAPTCSSPCRSGSSCRRRDRGVRGVQPGCLGVGMAVGSGGNCCRLPPIRATPSAGAAARCPVELAFKLLQARCRSRATVNGPVFKGSGAVQPANGDAGTGTANEMSRSRGWRLARTCLRRSSLRLSVRDVDAASTQLVAQPSFRLRQRSRSERGARPIARSRISRASSRRPLRSR